MFNRSFDAACAALSIILGLAAIGCVPPPCQVCGFTPNALLVVTDSNGGQSLASANSKGCFAYSCSAHLTIMQADNGVVINTGGQS